MRLEFDLNNNVEMPEIILGKRNYDKLGSIVNIEGFVYDYNLMSANSISFTVYKELNHEKERLWDDIKERRLIWLKEFNEWFQIDVETDDENEVIKKITGTSLCEAELGQILIRSTEINTEDDIARPEYKNPTVFYKPSNENESLLHRLLKKAPNYSIKYVDESLWNIQRTFSIDGTSIYDELTGEIAEEIGCLFLFDSTDRSISVYDLKTNCNHCGYRGDYTDVCPECDSTDLDYGYGRDTTIFVDSETLAESISLTGKQSEVKNYIKVSGGDDDMNVAIAACNPTGTQYFYAFSDRDKEDMSDSLVTKLNEYEEEYNSTIPMYKDIMRDYYDAIDELGKLESSMMPDITMAETNAEKELAKLVSKNLSPIAVQDVSIASVFTANNAVLGMAKCIVNSTVYKIEFVEGSTSFESQKWKGKFRIENRSDENDVAENTDYITLAVNDDYAYYVEQKIKKTIDRNDIYLVDMFDVETDINKFKEELKKYCLNRLISFKSAYQTIIDVLIEANCVNTSPYGDIYNDITIPYQNKLTAIQSEMNTRQSEIDAVNIRLESLKQSQLEITTRLNLENYLGEELWKELCAFRREDSFENSNYVSDGLTNCEVIDKAQELVNKAKNQAITASTLQMSLSTTMINLLAIPEFEKLTGMFEGGNWIRVGIDDKIYRLRLIHFRIDFSSIQNIEVEFSDVTQTANGLNDVNSLMNKVTSMATNFSYVAHQAEQGSKSFTELDRIRNDGLNTALYNISNSINQEFIIDEHGITGRQWDDILGDYLPEQVKMNNNILVYTNDYWRTAKSALGKIEYYNPILKTTVSQYGLIADAVISGILMGNDIIGGTIYSENYSSTAGTYINLNNGDFTFAGGKLVYDSSLNKMLLKGVTIEWDSSTTPEITDINGLDEQLSGIQDDLEQLDGRIQTYSQTSDPSTEWTTTADKQNHTGDLWYNPNTSITQRWNGTLWEKTTDSDLTALAQTKAQIFTSTPVVPYYEGDLWVQGATGDILNCIKTKTNGNYSVSDWVKSSKYTDDTSVNNLNTKMTQILSGDYKTTIGEDYVISPYIAGGYLYISDTKGSVLIDPIGIKKSDHIFSISNSSGDIVMGVDTNGNGTFDGKVVSNSGKIGGWDINSFSLYNGTNSMTSTMQGTYIGTNGIRQYNSSSAYVNIQSGVLTANGAIINSGKIGGWSLSTNALYSRGENQISGHGTAYYTYIQPFLTSTSEHFEDTWVISSQYAILSSNDEGTRYPFWYINVAGDIYTKGQIQLYSENYPQITGNGKILQLSAQTDSSYGVVIEASCFRPATSNGQFTLGSDNHKWGQIYSSNSVISTSDRKEKNTINTLDDDLTKKFIMSLNPVSYKYNNGTSDRLHYGLISQDVENSLNQLNIPTKDFAGFIKSPKTNTNYDTMEETIIEGEYNYGLRYEEFIAPLIKLVQIQENRIKKLENEIEKITIRN